MKRIKAVIFDLDDTLYDATELFNMSFKEVKIFLSKKGIDSKTLKSLEERIKKDSFVNSLRLFKKKIPEDLIERSLDVFEGTKLDGIKLSEDVLPTLEKITVIKILLTTGLVDRQRKKIRVLGLGGCFDKVCVDDIRKRESKKDHLIKIMESFNIRPEEVMVVGDKVVSEIKAGNELGMVTVQVMGGRHSLREASSELEIPNFKIRRISELVDIIERLSAEKSRSTTSEEKIENMGTGAVMGCLK